MSNPLMDEDSSCPNDLVLRLEAQSGLSAVDLFTDKVINTMKNLQFVDRHYEIIGDGVTVWVNGPEGNIARFGLKGIDIHQINLDTQAMGECLFCTHGATTEKDWDLFIQKMKELCGIEIPLDLKPLRFTLV